VETLRKNDHGPQVRQLQQLPAPRGHAPDAGGTFDTGTGPPAVRALQAPKLDRRGHGP
jgi:hypothetical protein